MSKTQVTINMSDVHYWFRTPSYEGGPCSKGLTRLLRRRGITREEDFTADMLRDELVKGAWDEISLCDYDTFLFVFLPGYAHSACEDALQDCVTGQEWSVVCAYYDITVEE